METMYERIKRMTPCEMQNFIYYVYLCGNLDGGAGLQDSPSGYFGGYILNRLATDVMPNDTTDDLWDDYRKTYFDEDGRLGKLYR